MDVATTLDALDELRGREVLVSIDRVEGAFKPQLACQGVLGAVRMVPEITDTGEAMSYRGEVVPHEERIGERGIVFSPSATPTIPPSSTARAGFYLTPNEFDHGSLKDSAVRLYLGDLTICLETKA